MSAIRSILLAAFVALLAAACTTTPKKEYVEPADEATQDCITVCKTERNECRRRADQEYERCRYVYERRRAERDACIHQGGMFCAELDPCPTGPQIKGCIEEYDRCYVACGGQIEVEEEGQP